MPKHRALEPYEIFQGALCLTELTLAGAWSRGWIDWREDLSDDYMKPSKYEQRTMERLADLGFDVEWNAYRKNYKGRKPDISMERVLWDIKAPQGQGDGNVSEQFTKLRAQGVKHGVIDLMRVRGSQSDYARKVARRLVNDRQLRDIIVIFRDGTGVRFRRRVD